MLLGATLVLLASIILGNVLGSRVIGKVGTALPVAVITPIPMETTAMATHPPDWKSVKVMVIATDPAFPDPRITPVLPTSPPGTPPPSSNTHFTENGNSDPDFTPAPNFEPAPGYTPAAAPTDAPNSGGQ